MQIGSHARKAREPIYIKKDNLFGVRGLMTACYYNPFLFQNN